ncbi:hypothetical protein TNCV_1925821 [Trichonephila clavipes]|nr:hypothetical protein TNCV_1925821 [Trichonephila clavipes]
MVLQPKVTKEEQEGATLLTLIKDPYILIAAGCRSCQQINIEVDSDDVQELMDSHNQEVTMDELVEMHEPEQDINELEPHLDSVQIEDRITFRKLTEGYNKDSKSVTNFKKMRTPKKSVFF